MAVKPVQRTCVARHRRFDAVRLEYNTERLPVPEYPGHFLLRRVTHAGTFRFQQRLPYIANALVNQQFGLEETDDDVWVIHVNTILLATLDERFRHPRVTPTALPMSSDTSVTYLSGCSATTQLA